MRGPSIISWSLGRELVKGQRLAAHGNVTIALAIPIVTLSLPR
jgi:hypothetical protein